RQERSRVGLVISTLLFMGGCASSPETELQHLMVTEIFWDAAHECDHFSALHVGRVAVNGDLTVTVVSSRTGELPLLTQCYWAGIARRVEHRRQAGLPVPESLNLQPGCSG